ncbi:HYR domain-containing protein [Yoonia tamlensis]|uniref:HYR domain-containing protein n=2 Tax=Yoonia tamlensis TaxID=390270 RepID=A0A1I6FVA2_9RHOB|nr:HYR domain-containing protein [Yoonia tamlensis]
MSSKTTTEIPGSSFEGGPKISKLILGFWKYTAIFQMRELSSFLKMHKATTRFLSIIFLSLLQVTSAFAHSTAVSYVVEANGDVTVWYASYHGGGNEGSVTLSGPVTVTLANNLFVTTQPAGITAANTTQATSCSGGSLSSPSSWQGVRFTGLAAGTYSIALTGSFSALWEPCDSSISSPTFTVFLDTGTPLFSGIPADINLTAAPGATTAVATWAEPSVSGAAGPATSTHASGDAFPIGATLVTYTAVASDGKTANVSFTVTVTAPPNATPTAEAGPAQAVTSGTLVTLAGSGTDTDGTIASYAWTRTGGTGDVSNAFASSSVQNPTFTDSSLLLDSDLPVTHVFSLVVTDDDGATSLADTVTITINPPEDTTPPEQPTNTVVITNDDSSLTVSGNAEDGATVEVTFPDGTTQTVVATGGTFTITSNEPQQSGNITIVVVDGVGLTSVPLVLTAVSGLPVPETQENIASFMQTRASQTIAAQPDLIGFLSGAAQGGIDMSATQGSGNFDVSTGAGYPVWGRLLGNWSESDDTENKYLFGAVGAHYAITPDALVGVILEFDHAIQESGDVTTEGTGYLAGPYLVAKLPDQPLYFEARYLVGQTENEISSDGTMVAEFDTERTLASVKVAGTLEYGELTLTPSLAATHMKDEQQSFVDAADRDVAAQSITTTDVVLSLDFAQPLEVPNGELILTGGLSAIMSENSGTGFAESVIPSFDGGRGRVHLGGRYTPDTDVVMTAGIIYDGIGADDYQSWGLNLGIDIKF